MRCRRGKGTENTKRSEHTKRTIGFGFVWLLCGLGFLSIMARPAWAEMDAEVAGKIISHPGVGSAKLDYVIEQFSPLYDSAVQIPKPEPVIWDKQGRRYTLSGQSVEPYPVTGRKEIVEGTVIYHSVDKKDKIPEEADIEIEDKESGTVFWAPLPLRAREYHKERWEDFEFKVTFHTYDADWYQLGERRIPKEGEEPSLEPYGNELLELIGIRPEDGRVDNCEWAGEPYVDEDGILCRDADAFGQKRVYDCHATYRGEAALPDYYRYRLKTTYKPETEEITSEETAEAGRESQEVAPMAKNWWQKLSRVVRLCLTVTVSLMFLLLALLGWRLLIKAARRIDKMEKEDKSLDQ